MMTHVVFFDLTVVRLSVFSAAGAKPIEVRGTRRVRARE
jgi:hypothetical protein